ncbi:MAG: AraC family transcriptional regulator [Lachnospiraceae bacterium]|nr:AraC family transcriptional regulator [Lachnospiraceae bacterium]
MENSIMINLPVSEEQDLCLNSFGHSVTEPCHRYGPAVRPYYLIHFILEGKGEFVVNNIHYNLEKGQGFLIEPDYQTTYTADSVSPWTYIWVGFSGRSAKNIVNSLGLTQDSPVFTCDDGETLKKYVLEMIRHNHLNPADTYRALGMFYLLISTIAGAQKNQSAPFDSNAYVQHAISYIHNHISEPMLVEEIAAYIGLNRSYLSVLFKKHTGMTPIRYIQTCRITKARHLLESSRLSIESIACSCGYQKPESLMKVFRQTYGISPTAYRRQVVHKSIETAQNIEKNVYSHIIGDSRSIEMSRCFGDSHNTDVFRSIGDSRSTEDPLNKKNL